MGRRKKRVTRRGQFAVIGALLVAIVVIAATSGSSGPTTRSTAIQNVVSKIDSGPSWETRQMSNAVGGYLKWQETDNGNDGGGGCAYINGQTAKGGFACYIQASEANGGASSYFSENASGSDIRPIGSSRYNRLIGG